MIPVRFNTIYNILRIDPSKKQFMATGQNEKQSIKKKTGPPTATGKPGKSLNVRRKNFSGRKFSRTGARLAGFVLLSARPMCLARMSKAGANNAGFVKVVNAMLDQGLV